MRDASYSDQVFDLGPRSSWAWLTAGVTLLGVAEGIALAAIAHALLPAPVEYLADVLIAVLTAAFLVAIGSALGGRITVDAEHLRLQFGLLGGTRVPRSSISQAEPFVPSAVRPVGLGIDVPPGSGQATVSRGGRTSFVRVVLDQPAEVRLALRRRQRVSELVLGTGAPDRLIAALG